MSSRPATCASCVRASTKRTLGRGGVTLAGEKGGPCPWTAGISPQERGTERHAGLPIAYPIERRRPTRVATSGAVGEWPSRGVGWPIPSSTDGKADHPSRFCVRVHGHHYAITSTSRSACPARQRIVREGFASRRTLRRCADIGSTFECVHSAKLGNVKHG